MTKILKSKPFGGNGTISRLKLRHCRQKVMYANANARSPTDRCGAVNVANCSVAVDRTSSPILSLIKRNAASSALSVLRSSVSGSAQASLNGASDRLIKSSCISCVCRLKLQMILVIVINGRAMISSLMPFLAFLFRLVN